MEAAAPVAPLLTLLDAVVRQDRGPAGLRGTICVAVRSNASTAVWCASFGGAVRTSFDARIPDEADAVLLLGDEEAEAILERGRLPNTPKLLALSGDAALLEKLVHRYLMHQNMLARQLERRGRRAVAVGDDRR